MWFPCVISTVTAPRLSLSQCVELMTLPTSHRAGLDVTSTLGMAMRM